MFSTTQNLVTSGTNQLNGGGGIAWTNPGNITANDGSLASISAAGTSKYLVGTGLGFLIPSNAIITGIILTLRADSSGGGQNAYLTKDGVTVSTTNKTTAFTGSISTLSYGSSSDLWGTTWTPTQINASTFGGVWQKSGNPIFGDCDYMALQVYYTVPTTELLSMML